MTFTVTIKGTTFKGDESKILDDLMWEHPLEEREEAARQLAEQGSDLDILHSLGFGGLLIK